MVYCALMVIGQRSTIKTIRPQKSEFEAAKALQSAEKTDSVDLSYAANSDSDFFGKGLVNRVLKWSSRVHPTTQKPMSEEEKQTILEKIQPGDVVLTYHSHRPNLGHIEYLGAGANYTHCALYEGYGRMIETLGNEVLRSSLVDRLDGTIKVAVVRPKYKSFKHRHQIIKAARNMEGTPYDARVDNKDSSEVYCSELIEVAMKKVDPDMEVPDRSFFGREVTAPDGFLEMEGAELIHDGKSEYWRNQLHQWPLHLGAAVGAGVGCLVGGPLGAVIGGVAGFEGTMAAIKHLQKDDD